jgi:hypothetical protein
MLQIGGIWKENFPRVTEWFERARARPSFKEAIERYIPSSVHDSYREAGEPASSIVREKFAKVSEEL